MSNAFSGEINVTDKEFQGKKIIRFLPQNMKNLEYGLLVNTKGWKERCIKRLLFEKVTANPEKEKSGQRSPAEGLRYQHEKSQQ